MRDTRIMMGMPITVEIVDSSPRARASLESAFAYFKYVDEKFSTYKDSSEIMQINRGELKLADASPDMKEIFKLSEETKQQTNGYFDIMNRKGIFDPSGIVKGWAILNAAKSIRSDGFQNCYVEAGGDIQTYGLNSEGKKWQIGIKNPFKETETVKVVELSGEGIATSGTYIRGQHIYNPKDRKAEFHDIVSLTVIGPDIYEADRFATSAFAMGKSGIQFIAGLPGFEGYLIDNKGVAVMTPGFKKYEHA